MARHVTIHSNDRGMPVLPVTVVLTVAEKTAGQK